MLDKKHLGRLATSHLAARQELRELIKHLALPQTTEQMADGAAPAATKPKLVA